MATTIRKWGNSASVRIPAPVMRAAGLETGMGVEVRRERGRVIIEPVQRAVYALDELLGRVTAENQHAEADFGPRQSREAWY